MKRYLFIFLCATIWHTSAAQIDINLIDSLEMLTVLENGPDAASQLLKKHGFVRQGSVQAAGTWAQNDINRLLQPEKTLFELYTYGDRVKNAELAFYQAEVFLHSSKDWGFMLMLRADAGLPNTDTVNNYLFNQAMEGSIFLNNSFYISHKFIEPYSEDLLKQHFIGAHLNLRTP